MQPKVPDQTLPTWLCSLVWPKKYMVKFHTYEHTDGRPGRNTRDAKYY